MSCHCTLSLGNILTTLSGPKTPYLKSLPKALEQNVTATKITEKENKEIKSKKQVKEENKQIEIGQTNPCSTIFIDGSSMECTSCNTHYIDGVCVEEVVDNCKSYDEITLRCKECVNFS